MTVFVILLQPLFVHETSDSMTLNCSRDINRLFLRQIANAFEIETKDCLILYVSYVAIYFSNMFQLSSCSKYSSESGFVARSRSASHISNDASNYDATIFPLEILKSGHFCTLIYFVHG